MLSKQLLAVVAIVSGLFCLNDSEVWANTGDSACIDTDGDGWGWDGSASCKITLPCIDNDGDGWGWNGTGSCRIGVIPVTACIDLDGDGWGWDGTNSCIPGMTESSPPQRLTLGVNLAELNEDAYGFGASPPVVGSDGRFVLFDSFADNIIDNDGNNKSDVFLRDTVSGEVRLISQGSGGEAANKHSIAEAISTSGRFSVFSSYATNLVDNNLRGGLQLYLYDSAMDTMKVISLPTDNQGIQRDSQNARISSGGGDVFYQTSTGFVAGGTEILHYIVSSGETRTIFPASQGNALIKDYASSKLLYFRVLQNSGLTGQFYLYDVADETQEPLPVYGDFWDSAKIADNGNLLLFTIDNEVILLDRTDGGNTLTTLRSAADADISNNGRWLLFTKPGNDPDSDTSASGTHNLFIEDLISGNAYLLSKGLSGNGLNDYPSFPRFTGFNNAIVFSTRATNLVSGDNNGTNDVYRYEFDAY